MADQNIWQRFAKMLGVEERHAEDALHSERVARHVVSRRSFLGASAALAGAAVFAFPTPAQDELRQLPIRRGSTLTSFDRMLKERYTDESVKALTWDDDPYLRTIKGLDPTGQIDSAPAIQEALNNGGLWLPSGKFKLAQVIKLPDRGALTRA